ncbi:MAG: carboxypeptidase-like regulatory domain-containing protein [Chitinophagales bacterium]
MSTIYSSCTKKADEIPGPAGLQGLPGNNVSLVRPSAITGYVRLIDQYGYLITNGDSVTATTSIGDSSVAAITDADGKFILPNMPAGSYAIRFKKSGYDSFVVNVVHSGGNADKFIGIVQLSQHLSTNILGETITVMDNPFGPPDTPKVIQLIINIDGPPFSPPYNRFFFAYFSRNSEVSNQHYDFIWDNGNTGPSNSNIILSNLSTQNIESSGMRYNKGDTIYMKTYMVPPFSVDASWYDINNFRTISYPYVGDSALRYFLWPN